jgi:hypothetical protein
VDPQNLGEFFFPNNWPASRGIFGAGVKPIGSGSPQYLSFPKSHTYCGPLFISSFFIECFP